MYFPKKNLCRVSNCRHSAKKDVAEHRYAGQPMLSAALLSRAWHSAKKSFAECPCLPSVRHSAKNSLPSVILCRVQHSVKKVFVECSIFDTRQRILHSAKSLFPVVQEVTYIARSGQETTIPTPLMWDAKGDDWYDGERPSSPTLVY